MTTPGSQTPRVCDRCGAHGEIPHGEVEGDCLLQHRMDKPYHPPRAKVGFICGGCVKRWQDSLIEIVQLYERLEDVVEPGSVDEEDMEAFRHPKRSASPSPVRLEPWAMLHDTARLVANPYNAASAPASPPDYVYTATPDVFSVLNDMADHLYECLGEQRQDMGTVSTCARLLTNRLETIAGLYWVVDFDDEVKWLLIALRRAHGIARPRPLGKCLNRADGSECPRGRVWRTDDGRGPKCDRCGRRYTHLDLVRLKLNERTENEPGAVVSGG